MVISTKDVLKKNQQKAQEAFNYHWEKHGGLWLRTEQSLKDEREQLQEQERLRKKAEDRQGILKSGNENGILGTLASGVDLLAKFGEGASRTLEGQVDWALYKTADQNRFTSKLAKDLFGEGNLVSNFYDFLGEGFSDTAKHNSTQDIFGTNGENSLFENMMWMSGTAEKEAAKKSAEILGKDNWITKGLDFGSKARLNASQLRNDGKNWRETIDESSYMGDLPKQVAEGAGNIAMMAMEAAVGSEILGMAGMTTINPATGVQELSTAGRTLLTFGNSFTSAYGNARSTAYENGADDVTAHRAGFINGLAEGLSELAFDAMPGINSPGFLEKLGAKTGLKDFVTNRLEKAMGKHVAKYFLNLVGGAEEGAEEMLSNAIVALGNDAMHMMDESYTYGMENQTGNILEDMVNAFFSQESIDAFVSAGLTSVLLGFGGTILNNAQTNQVINAYAKDNGMSFKEAKDLFNQVVNNTGEDSVREQVAREGATNSVEIDDLARERVKNYMKAHTGNSTEINLRNFVLQEAKQKGLTLDEGQIQERMDELRNEVIDATNSPERYTTFQQEAKNENDAELIKSLQDTDRNNTYKTHQMYEFASKLQDANENAKIRFINNEMIKKNGNLAVDENGKVYTINGYNDNGVVYINVDGKNPYQQIAYHEIAHSIKDSTPELYEQLKNMIINYANQKDLEQYKKMYGVKEGYSSELTQDYRDEYVNDTLGEKLNDGKFIDELTGNRNLLQKILDKIKEMISYMTSGKEKKQMISLKNQLQEKYKQGFNEADFKGAGKTDYMLAKTYGDLGKGRDTYYTMVDGSRSTGHFGTGTYFVNNDYEPGKSSSYASRPTNSVEFDDYYLYRPSTERQGFELHDGLKAINSKVLFNEEQINEIRKKFRAYQDSYTEESTQDLLKTLKKYDYDVDSIENKFATGWSTEAENDLVDMTEDIIDDYDRNYRDYRNMVSSIIENNSELNPDRIREAFEATRNALEDYNEKGYEYGDSSVKVDSLSTIFMKNLGYNGIDVTGLEGLDNTTYGSVIYDLDNKLENVAELKYNSIEEAIKAEPAKADFAKYSTDVRFFNLELQEMQEVIAKTSNFAELAEQNGMDYGVVNMNLNGKDYTSYFDLLNKNNENNEYGITRFDEVSQISKEVADETNPNTNIEYSLEDTRNEQGLLNRNNQSIENRETGTRDVNLPTAERIQQGTNENRQITKESNTNNKLRSNNASFSLSPEIQDKVNHSMSMDDMSRLLDMAFAESDIEEYSDGAVTNVQEWLDNEDWNYQIPLIAENTQVIQEKYLNNLDESFNEDYTFEDILEAYKNKTLVGKEKASRTDLELSKETGRIDNRFYAPQSVEATKELYDKANQRVTNSNRDEVYKARADFIIAAHDKNTASKLGLTQQEVNSKLKSWANYPKSAMEISNRVNEGVARENQWSGLENSSIVNYIAVTDDQMKSMVKEVKGKSDEYQRKYITSAMLAIDTHIDYSKLTFEFGVNEELAAKHANGDYFYDTDTIRVRDASQNTIAHEMGHYINSVWAREIFGFEKNPLGSPLTAMALRYNHDVFHLTDEQQQFLNNFNLFIDDLQNSAILKTGSNRGIEYWQDRDEVFARFVAKFTEWTKNQATNGRFDYESKYYSGHGDSFTTKQYMDFIKILQEKSALESMTQPKVSYSLSQDSQGRELTQEQQEYFKDSKVRDDNGNLKVMYHGTPTGGFTIFDNNQKQRDVGFLGKGFYFTGDIEDADEYSKDFNTYDYTDNSKVYENYLNITNPYIIPADTEYRSDMLVKILGVQPEQIQKTLVKQGYDGIIYDNPAHNEYVVFNSNQIKNTDNTNPTQDTDIRYSLSADGLKNLANELGESYSMLESNLTGRDRAGIKRYLENYTGIVDKYLADNNIQVEPAYRDIEFTRVRTPELQQFVRDNDLTIEKLANDQELQDKYFDLWFGDSNEERFTKQWRDLLDFVKENPRESEIPRPLRAIQREMQQIRDGETQEIDESATKSKKLDAAIDNGYDFWIEDVITPLFEKIDYDEDEVMEEAKANHGTTDNYNVGAYMTTDGSLLDFDDGGYRDDHRTISVFNLDMQEFMDYGAIRMKPEANGFEMAVEPTTEQYSRLEDYIDNYLKTNAGVHGDNSTIWVDFDIPGTNNYNSASYNVNTPTSKIINDIKEYWRTGELPKQSEYADFYYSLSKNNQQTANGLEGTARIDSYEDYLKSLPSYQKMMEQSTESGLPFEGNHGVLTKEDYKNKKIELFNKRIEAADNRMENQAKKFARENMELSRKAKQDLDTLINEYKGMSREEIYNSDARQQIKDFVAKNSRQEFVEEIVNEDIRDLQRAIRNTEFTIDKNAAGEFADGITQFKKNNPGIKIKYGNQDIDSKYQELAQQYPGILETDVTDKDIPFILADFLKKPYRQFDNNNVQVFELSEQEVDNIANKIYHALTNNAISDNDLESMAKEISDKVQEKYGRQLAKAKNTEFAKDLLEQIGLENIKDKKHGAGYKINTMKRNLRDVINSKEKAQLFYDKVFKPVTIHNAQSEIDRQTYVDRMSKYNLNNNESTYAQMLGELKYNPESDLTTAQVEGFAQKHNINKQKCLEAMEEARNIYDELFDRVSEAYRANGYPPLEYRKGYFPHFIEDKPTSLIGKLAKGLGWNVQKGQLPTDLAGITDMLEPGRAWTTFSQQRTGDATDYNLLKGMDNYLRGAMDVIYHTEDIQRIRAIENQIRYEYSSKGIQQKIDAIRQDQDLSPEEQAAQIAAIVDNQQNNPLGNFVSELRDYANGLANKKSILDRGMEQFGGREWYSRMQQINSRVSANMVGMNISSAITNFIPLTQGWSQISTKNMLRAMYASIQNIVRNDGFDLNSIYLMNRTHQAENLYNTRLDTINKKLGALFEGIDSFTANTLVRGKYLENLDKGMTELQAMENADEFAKDVMAGRSKGDSPTIFNSKNPLVRLFTAFQLEVNNQYGYMFKDIPVDMAGEAKDKLAMAFVKMFIGAWLYNWITEKITGRKAAFSPIDMAVDDYKTITNENMDFASKVESIAKDTAQELPFISGIMGGGRLPIQGAIPYENPASMITETFSDVGKAFDEDEEKRNTAINNLKKEWLKPVYFLGLPFAGGQLKKLNEGMAMYNENLPVKGSYTNSGKLRFEADTSPLGVLQSAVFGQYASQNARDYFENGYQPLSQKQVNEALDANLPISDYREINQGISNARAVAKANKENQTAAMFDYINSLPLSDEQKNSLINSRQGNSSEVKDDNGYIKYTDGSKTYWYDADNDIVYNNKYKEVNKDIDELTKYSNIKDVSNYGDYGSYEEYTYATKNPEKYNVIKQITDYDKFVDYKDEISAIKENYKTTAGKKKAVAKYINSLNLSEYQKIMLYKEAGGYSIKQYSKQMQKYIDDLDIDVYDKYLMYDELFGTKYAKEYSKNQTNLPPSPPTTNLPTTQVTQTTPQINLPTAEPAAPYYEPEEYTEYRTSDTDEVYYKDEINDLLYDKDMNPVVDERKYDEDFENKLIKAKYTGDKKKLVKYFDNNHNIVWLDEDEDLLYDEEYNLINDDRIREPKAGLATNGWFIVPEKYDGDKEDLKKITKNGKTYYLDEETGEMYDKNLKLIWGKNLPQYQVM